jgi:hypothetical protein
METLKKRNHLILSWKPRHVEVKALVIIEVGKLSTIRECIQKFPDWVDNEINNKKQQ